MQWADYGLYKDKYKGQRCFIFGTGVSLTWMPRELIERVLKNEWTIGCNGLYLWEGMVKPPTFYCMIDHPAFPKWREGIEALDTIRVAGLRHDWSDKTPEWVRVLQRRDMRVTDGNFGGTDAKFTWCAGGSNVIWTLCTQLAFWLGFSEVYLLGNDGWTEGAPRVHCYELRDLLLGKITGTDSPINTRTFNAARLGERMVYHFYTQAGRTIVNCNPDSALMDGIPKRSLSEVV
jgi:hypothetical protein